MQVSATTSDTSLEVEKTQLELLRRSSVRERLNLTFSLTQTALDLARRAIARANPNASQRELDLIFVEVHYGKELAEQLRDYLLVKIERKASCIDNSKLKMWDIELMSSYA